MQKETKMQIITLTTKVLVSRHEKCDYALTFIRQQQSTGSHTRHFQFPLETQWICQQHIYPPSFSAFSEKWEIDHLEWMYHVQHFSKNTKTNNNNKKHNKLQRCIAQRLLLPSNIKWWCTTSWTLSGGFSFQPEGLHHCSAIDSARSASLSFNFSHHFVNLFSPQTPRDYSLKGDHHSN